MKWYKLKVDNIRIYRNNIKKKNVLRWVKTKSANCSNDWSNVKNNKYSGTEMWR